MRWSRGNISEKFMGRKLFFHFSKVYPASLKASRAHSALSEQRKSCAILSKVSRRLEMFCIALSLFSGRFIIEYKLEFNGAQVIFSLKTFSCTFQDTACKRYLFCPCSDSEQNHWGNEYGTKHLQIDSSIQSKGDLDQRCSSEKIRGWILSCLTISQYIHPVNGQTIFSRRK